MASHRSHVERSRKASLWSTIDRAVAAGWNQTARLVVVLVVLGALCRIFHPVFW
jgi:hypothetical protein